MTALQPHSGWQRAMSLLLIVGLVVAPALGWTPSRLFDQPSDQQTDGCCFSKLATEQPTNQHPNDESDPCKDCRAGFCLCVGAVFVIDQPILPTGDANPPRLWLAVAQLSHPESASLEDIFHPPRA